MTTLPKSNYISRDAEVLLLYAEALNENSKSGEALTWLNKMRTRARNTPTADPQRNLYCLRMSTPNVIPN